MNDCTWIGLMGYVFAFLFFFVGLLSATLETITNIKFGKRYGWHIVKGSNWEYCLKTPFRSILCNIIILLGGVYFFFYKLGFVIIPKYWHCLMLSS